MLVKPPSTSSAAGHPVATPPSFSEEPSGAARSVNSERRECRVSGSKEVGEPIAMTITSPLPTVLPTGDHLRATTVPTQVSVW